MRRMVALAVFLAAASLSVPSAEARSGAVFIHGAGSNFLNDAAGARAYWTEDMLRASTRNWTVPYLVAHYDGTQLHVDRRRPGGGPDLRLDDGQRHRRHRGQHAFLRRYGHPLDHVQPDLELALPGHHRAHPLGQLARRAAQGLRGGQPGRDAGGSWLTGWLVEPGRLQHRRAQELPHRLDGLLQPVLPLRHRGPPGAAAQPSTTVAGTGLWNDFVARRGLRPGHALRRGRHAGRRRRHGVAVQRAGVGYVWFTTAANHHHNRRNDYRKLGDNLGSDFAFALAGGNGKAGAPRRGPGGHGLVRRRALAAPAQVSRTFVRTVALSAAGPASTCR